MPEHVEIRAGESKVEAGGILFDATVDRAVAAKDALYDVKRILGHPAAGGFAGFDALLPI